MSDPLLYAVTNQVYLANLVKSLSHLPLSISSQIFINTVYGGFFLVSKGHQDTKHISLCIYLYENRKKTQKECCWGYVNTSTKRALSGRSVTPNTRLHFVHPHKPHRRPKVPILFFYITISFANCKSSSVLLLSIVEDYIFVLNHCCF